ncbi:TRAP transporter substrate-binding protein DctP [Thermodesulfobacteriota bacterium]
MKRLILVPLLIVLTIGLVFVGYADEVSAKPVVLKAITFLPKQAFSVRSIFPLVERVNARAKGKVEIKYLGGPEVIPPPRQAEAIRNNVVQIALCPVEYFEAQVKMGNMAMLSELKAPDEEYKTGAYDYLQKLFTKGGLHYVGRATSMSDPKYFWFITNKKIKRPQDLAGQKIAASTPWPIAFLKAVGATMVQIQIPEFYTSLERGVVDGVADPLTNHMTFQLHEVCKYVISPGVGNGALVMIMNLDAWKKLPQDVQKIIQEVNDEVLREYIAAMDKEVQKAMNTAKSKGMEVIKFSPEDEKWFVNTYYEESWKANIKKYPAVAPKLRKLFSRSSLP